jgi:LuxR family maltose regulon positive regulatory protein
VTETELLLKTKFYVPQAYRDLVSRPRLIEQLDEAIRHRLTLISAPAGFGKTTTLSEWRMIHLGNDWSVGWVSLDEGDNDPVLFFSYLIAALRSIEADLGETSVGKGVKGLDRAVLRLLRG